MASQPPKLSAPQRAALVALLHDDDTRISIMPISNHAFVTNRRGWGLHISTATLRVLSQNEWVNFQGYAREYRLTAEGRVLAQALEAQERATTNDD